MESANMQKGVRQTIRSGDAYEVKICTKCEFPVCSPRSVTHCHLNMRGAQLRRDIYDYIKRNEKTIEETARHFVTKREVVVENVLFLERKGLLKLKLGVLSA